MNPDGQTLTSMHTASAAFGAGAPSGPPSTCAPKAHWMPSALEAPPSRPAAGKVCSGRAPALAKQFHPTPFRKRAAAGQSGVDLTGGLLLLVWFLIHLAEPSPLLSKKCFKNKNKIRARSQSSRGRGFVQSSRILGTGARTGLNLSVETPGVWLPQCLATAGTHEDSTSQAALRGKRRPGHQGPPGPSVG